jgi:AbrB family looped-hinge helix DNA binding protein
MTHKVGPKGQVVIPKEIRDHLGIHPGDEVIFIEDEGGVRVERRGDVRKFGGVFAHAPFDLTRELEEDRRRAREKEEHEISEWSRREGGV